jgi:hypothetical protein
VGHPAQQVAELTHPTDATLGHPLFCRQKRGLKNKIPKPSLRLAVERVVKRSEDRVGKLYNLQFKPHKKSAPITGTPLLLIDLIAYQKIE